MGVDQPDRTLFLASKPSLPFSPGTKLGCGEGGCGACTVTVSQFLGESGTCQHRAVTWMIVSGEVRYGRSGVGCIQK